MNGGTPRESVAQFQWTIGVGIALVTLALLGWAVQPRLGDPLPMFYIELLQTALTVGLLLIIVFGIGYFLQIVADRSSLTAHQREVTYRFVQLSAIAIGLLVITIAVWEFRVENVLIGAGMASVVLAIAARKTLGSMLSGVIIMTTDIFRVGDWVKIDQRFGRIEHISLFNTIVRSPQGETHIFPNDDLTARDITNLGHKRYRNDVLIGVDYDTDLSAAIDICNDVLKELTEDRGNHVDGYNPTSIKGFEDSQITLAVKIWVRHPTPRAINLAQTTALSALHKRFRAEEIVIPFPQRVVSDRGDGSPLGG